mgnify:CR=1 FL=1
MKKSLLCCVLVCVCMLAAVGHSSNALADWEEYKRVQTRNSDGHTLRFDRYGQGQLRVWLILKHEQNEAFAGKTLRYKVDNHAVRKIGPENVRIKKGRWLYWELPCAGKECLEHQRVQEFLQGETVVWQFELPDGRIEEAVFSLEGVESALKRLCF